MVISRHQGSLHADDVLAASTAQPLAASPSRIFILQVFKDCSKVFEGFSLVLSQKGMSYQDFRNQGLKPPQGQLGSYKDFKFQGFKKGLNVSKTSHTFQG